MALIIKPKTIGELKKYCAQRDMPIRRMRFFIGENYQEPKAFGIYQDGDRYVVYKNKADGSRSIRYEGPDEAYAVNELYQKILDECHKRNIYPNQNAYGSTRIRNTPGSRRKRMRPKTKVIIFFSAILAIVLAVVISNAVKHSRDGYYRVSNDRMYYRYGDRWFRQSGDSWYETYVYPDDDGSEYFAGNTFNDEWGGTEFDDSYARKDNDRSGSRSGDRYSDSSDSYYPDSSDAYSDYNPGDTDWVSDW